jgi:hypothetical protein
MYGGGRGRRLITSSYSIAKRNCSNGKIDICSIGTYAVVDLGIDVIVLISFMAIDYISGIMGGIINRNFCEHLIF